MSLKDQIKLETDKNFHEALSFYTKALELDDKLIESRYHMAIVLQKT
jgi:TPR repeat protein